MPRSPRLRASTPARNAPGGSARLSGVAVHPGTGRGRRLGGRGAALRPVERRRQEADAISVSDRARRLPVPATRDEIERLGNTLNAMLGRLEAAFDAERRFVDDASHELRTPWPS
jgi:signal transduction histidine kinase